MDEKRNNTTTGSGTGNEEEIFHEWDQEALSVMQLRGIIPDKIDWIKHTKAIITLINVVILLILAGVILGIYGWDYGLIADGVSVNGIDIGHLTPVDAKARIAQQNLSTLRHKVEFDTGQEKLEISLEDLGLTYNPEKVLDQAYSIGRQGSITHKIMDKLRASRGLQLFDAPVWNEEKLNQALQNNLAHLNIAPRDASFSIENNSMTIHKEIRGSSVNISHLAEEVKKLDPVHLHPLMVPLNEIKPAVTSSQFENLKPSGILATYSTRFDPTLINRTHNIQLAAKALDGLLLKPGENFSFNDRVGPRTVKAGYLEAIIIENGEFVPGLGGGICQVSTTLYNTLLLADLSVTERDNHALSIAYAPLGQDATVAYGSLDLKFINNSGGYLLIRSQVSGDTLTFTLYGKTTPEKEVIISSHVVQTILPREQKLIDSSLPAGTVKIWQSGQPGYIVKTTRTVKIKGETIKTETLGTSTYQPVAKIIAVGP